jgi:hypothetical protein
MSWFWHFIRNRGDWLSRAPNESREQKKMPETNSQQPLPPGEASRLATLRSLEILDTASEESFDELTALAANICQTPIALVSLVDEDRQLTVVFEQRGFPCTRQTDAQLDRDALLFAGDVDKTGVQGILDGYKATKGS